MNTLMALLMPLLDRLQAASKPSTNAITAPMNVVRSASASADDEQTFDHVGQREVPAQPRLRHHGDEVFSRGHRRRKRHFCRSPLTPQARTR